MKILQNRKYLIITVIIALIIIISGAFLIYQNITAAPGRYAVISQNGEVIRQIDLSDSQESYTFTVETADGGHNTIQVENGEIGVIEANCPDKVCQKMGMTSSTVYPISCLPHKLLIEIESTDASDSEPDAIVH